MKYVCLMCGYVYDDEKEAVPFASLPDDWTCPMCGAPKEAFELQEEPDDAEEPGRAEEQGDVEELGEDEEPTAALVAPAGASLKTAEDEDGDVLVGLSVGQLAALCGNLARGCEKQARGRESELFTQLAHYFEGQVTPEPDASIDALADLLLGDTGERYVQARKVATEQADRGALRVITWGERITNMLKYLLSRYEKEGEAMLADAEIWVCTVCGFVYVGKAAPELCPVCKVPAWKFQKIERRAS